MGSCLQSQVRINCWVTSPTRALPALQGFAHDLDGRWKKWCVKTDGGRGERNRLGKRLVAEHNLTNFKRKRNKNQTRNNVLRQEHSWLRFLKRPVRCRQYGNELRRGQRHLTREYYKEEEREATIISWIDIYIYFKSVGFVFSSVVFSSIF